MGSERIEIEILRDFGDYKKGQIIKTPAILGIPLQQEWRDRLKDAEIDNCVKICHKRAPKPSKNQQESEE